MEHKYIVCKLYYILKHVLNVNILIIYHEKLQRAAERCKCLEGFDVVCTVHRIAMCI